MAQTKEQAELPSTSTDAKAEASTGFRRVIEASRKNYPDPQFYPHYLPQIKHGRREVIHSSYSMGIGKSDGTGTKPNISERLYDLTKDPNVFKNPPHDGIAMVDGDYARDGDILVGVNTVVDVTAANNPAVMEALASGMEDACKLARIALLNGETAELGPRLNGPNEFTVNINVSGYGLVNARKAITGERLAVGLPVVGIKEPGVRSNGLTRIGKILDAGYLHKYGGYKGREDYFLSGIENALGAQGIVRESRLTPDFLRALDQVFGINVVAKGFIPWHRLYPELTHQLAIPSTLYGPLIHEANGWVNWPKKVDLVAAAHITGGGIPEKVGRMLKETNLGAYIDGTVFPDPLGIQGVMEVARGLPNPDEFITEREACEQWSRGYGFIVVPANEHEADAFIKLAAKMGYEADKVGNITNQPTVEFKGFSWAIN